MQFLACGRKRSLLVASWQGRFTSQNTDRALKVCQKSFDKLVFSDGQTDGVSKTLKQTSAQAINTA
jgi:hypothetical protein